MKKFAVTTALYLLQVTRATTEVESPPVEPEII